MPWTSIRVHEKLGPLVRIGSKYVSVSSPESVNIIYGSNSQYGKVGRRVVRCLEQTVTSLTDGVLYDVSSLI